MKTAFLIGDSKVALFYVENLRSVPDEFIVIQERRKKSRIKSKTARLKKYGFLKTTDEMLFSLYSKLFLKKIQAKETEKYITKTYTGPKIIVNDINSDKVKNLLIDFAPNIIMVYGTRILKPAIFELSDYSINVHLGITPDYRGTGNIWAIYCKDWKNIGATIHEIDAGVDTGNIIETVRINVLYSDNIFSIRFRSFVKATERAYNILKAFKNNGVIISKPISSKGKFRTGFGITNYFLSILRLRNYQSKIPRY